MADPISTIEVCVSIAVSESGREKCHIADSNWLQEQRSYKAWVDEIRQDKQLWSIKTVKVKVPAPMQYEDMRSIEAAKQGGESNG